MSAILTEKEPTIIGSALKQDMQDVIRAYQLCGWRVDETSLGALENHFQQDRHGPDKEDIVKAI